MSEENTTPEVAAEAVAEVKEESTKEVEVPKEFAAIIDAVEKNVST